MKIYFDHLYTASKESCLSMLQQNLQEERKTFVVTANPEAFMFGEKDSDMHQLLIDDQVTVVADGIGVVKSAGMLGIQVEERIPGVEIAQALMAYGHEMKKKIFLLGAKQEVVDAMCAVIQTQYPGLILAGAINGYVPDKDAAFDEIVRAQPDIVLVDRKSVV